MEITFKTRDDDAGQLVTATKQLKDAEEEVAKN